MLRTVLILLITTINAFTYFHIGKIFQSQTTSTLNMGIMDNLKKAFENEEFAKPSKNGNIDTKNKIVVDICGRKISAIKGQQLKNIIRASGAPIKFNCEKGECGSCEALVNGKKIRTCRKILTGPTTIKIK